MNGESGLTSTLISVVIVALVVIRFTVREMKDRVVKPKGLWTRPVLFALLALVFGYEVFQIPGQQPMVFFVEVVVSLIIGIIVGWFVVRYTTFAPAPRSAYPAVRAQGSWKTIVVWVIAIGIRFAARLLVRDEGAAEQAALNVALFVLATGAFGYVALRFQQAIRAFPPVD